jgi:hypothetical protein
LKNRQKIEKFIELRVLGTTYDEIVKKIKISKPTLIKWGKVYKEEIEFAGLSLTQKLAEKVARDNSDMILIIAENLKRAEQSRKEMNHIKEKYIEKAFNKLGNIFKVEVKNIELKFNKNGDIKEVIINTK